MPMRFLARHLLLPLAVLSTVLAGCSMIIPAPAPSGVSDTLVPIAPMAAWAMVLERDVDGQGRVDFQDIATNPERLGRYVAYVYETGPNNDPAAFPLKEDRLAYYINSYNALSMYNVVKSGIPERLSLIGRYGFFKATTLQVGRQTISLYDYENDLIRPVGDERVHFALNCMAVSCPRLLQKPFLADDLDRQLDAAARLFFSEPRNLQVDTAHRMVRVSSILKFYTEDFLKKSPSLIDYINQYRHEKIPTDYQVEFLEYDWTINRQPARG